MKTCPCPCRQPVKRGRRYASRGCYMRHNRHLASERGKEGGAASGHIRMVKAVEQFDHIADRQKAIWAAIQWALSIRANRRYRQRQANTDANGIARRSMNASGVRVSGRTF